MRIATWNVNGLRARLEFVRAWLRERKPDIVGLQELKLTDDKFPHDAFAELGYFAAVHGQKSWNGVAILAREAPQVTQCGLPGQEEMGARLLSADAAGLSFTTVYVPNGKNLEHEDYTRKLAWLDTLTAHFAARQDPDAPAVLCGDFNICPTDLDSWNAQQLRGAIFHTPAERERWRSVTGTGLEDVWRALHPDTQAFSWWDYRGGAFHRKQGLRIDFLLATAAVRRRVQGAEIDREWRKKQAGLTASDHAPVWLDLE
ncbi:MAG: exodeoxyribonuclease III [Deltaproteobacteria bacterium]|nr:exodeoxyribonuclease III [Deltaproteobacteria bacterium]MBW2361091.1 exodeoxyribonuclease III [Deltaproteobacteria bacterium]